MIKNLNSYLLAVWSLGLIVGAISCSSDNKKQGEEIPVVLTVKQTSVTVEEGQTVQLEASVSPEGTKINWTSKDATIATVSETGLLSAIKPGNTSVEVSAIGAETKNIAVIVTQKKVPEENKYHFEAADFASYKLLLEGKEDMADKIRAYEEQLGLRKLNEQESDDKQLLFNTYGSKLSVTNITGVRYKFPDPEDEKERWGVIRMVLANPLNLEIALGDEFSSWLKKNGLEGKMIDCSDAVGIIGGNGEWAAGMETVDKKWSVVVLDMAGQTVITVEPLISFEFPKAERIASLKKILSQKVL